LLARLPIGDGLHIADLLLDPGDRRRPDRHHQVQGPLRRLRHPVLEAPLGVVLVAEQADPLVAQAQDLGDERVVVVVAAVVAAAVVGAPDLLAQLAVVGVGEERVDRRAGVGDRKLAGVTAGPGLGGGGGLERRRRPASCSSLKKWTVPSSSARTLLPKRVWSSARRSWIAA
jgi:hypothetical protein